MNIPSRTLKTIGGGIAVAIAATVISLQAVTLNVAVGAADRARTTAQDAAGAAFILRSGNEAISDRFQTRDAGSAFFAVVAVEHPHAYSTLSMTYSAADGTPVTEGGFELAQADGGLEVVIHDDTPPGDYRVVIGTLTPSEIDHDLIFYVTVTPAEGGN